MKYISRTVWVLSLVSLFTDVASEMLYPVLPLYMQQLGYSVVFIGVLEGVAECAAGLSKGYFGALSDKLGQRVPFIRWGYGLSAAAKPMMVMLAKPWWVFLTRTADRLGKGIRTGARDALLAESAQKAHVARVFSFHRAMDTLGAVIGPILALIYLKYHPHDYAKLFIAAVVPGLLAVAATYLLKHSGKQKVAIANKESFISSWQFWRNSHAAYKKLSIGFLIFALFNSSDMFLLLAAKQAGFDDTGVIWLYIFYNLVYAVVALPAGIAADRLGLKMIYLLSLLCFAVVYFGLALPAARVPLIVWFLIYGIYAASSEGIAKAWLSRTIAPAHKAQGLGLYAGMQSVCALIASSVTGVVWHYAGLSTALIITGVAALLAAVYLINAPEHPVAEAQSL